MLHHMYVYVYIYIEREREKEKERDRDRDRDIDLQPQLCCSGAWPPERPERQGGDLAFTLVADKWGQHKWSRCKNSVF